MMQFAGLFSFLLMLLPLVILQRLLHREIQVVILILTRNRQLTVGLFSVLFFPGVFLHELSHFVMARVLGVPTRDFSLIPHSLPNGRVQMGYVETEKSDIVRDSLIGLAPLISGTLFMAYVGLNRLQVDAMQGLLVSGQFDLFVMELGRLPQVADFYLWFYLAFTVSSTMMPSESDRHAWLPLGLWAGVLFGLALLTGAGPWMLENLAPFLDEFLGAVATLFGLSIALHVVLLLPTVLAHRLASQVTGMDVA
jgi:hypothetical protein